MQNIKKSSQDIFNNSTFAIFSFSNNKQEEKLIFCDYISQFDFCLYGEKHWWTNCSYLNKKMHSQNWKEKFEVQKKVDEKIKNSKIKTKIEKNFVRHDKRKKNEKKKNITKDKNVLWSKVKQESSRENQVSCQDIENTWLRSTVKIRSTDYIKSIWINCRSKLTDSKLSIWKICQNNWSVTNKTVQIYISR